MKADHEKSHDGIWIIDSDARTVYVNSRMAEILGTSVDAMVGEPSFDYLFPEDIFAARQLFNAKARGNSEPFVFKLRRKDGSAAWTDGQGTPMHNAAGTFKGIVGTFTIRSDAALNEAQQKGVK